MIVHNNRASIWPVKKHYAFVIGVIVKALRCVSSHRLQSYGYANVVVELLVWPEFNCGSHSSKVEEKNHLQQSCCPTLFTFMR